MLYRGRLLERLTPAYVLPSAARLALRTVPVDAGSPGSGVEGRAAVVMMARGPNRGLMRTA